MTETVEMLPDLPGRTHGIKSINPYVVQCDGCRTTVTHDGREPYPNFFGRIWFANIRSGDGRRMCASCWKTEGIGKS